MTDTRRARHLSELVERVRPLAVLGDVDDCVVTDVVIDHRKVEPGALFCCIPGLHRDGHDFAGLAKAAGAVAFVSEHSLGPRVGDAVQLVVGPGQARSAAARAACAFFGDPAASMASVGVTGTNGKTTTTYLLAAIFERHGWSTEVVGTLGGGRTTPEAPDLQRLLAAARDKGRDAFALEVSSHALVQHRVDGIELDAAVFTNLSQDHLDFHETMEAYFTAKASLFVPGRARIAVVNADDDYGRRLLERTSLETVAFSLEDVRDLEVGLDSSTFRLGGRVVHLPLGGLFNVRNALAAAACSRALGLRVDEIVEGLEQARPVPGRFEAVRSGEGIVVIVDYAHTPAGLEELLRAAQRIALADRGRLVAVFGCGGERDRGKRPVMGAVASRLADVVVITTDNPRGEDPAHIAGEILAGVDGPARVLVELDRREAIAQALALARRGDVVVVAGKGHEATQELSGRTLEFDDRAVVREELMRLERATGERAGATPRVVDE
jgi:UDP-N-acetylmuramoyl-L-alanyl-D-glutamate--2,6-diaminopimelate ligase